MSLPLPSKRSEVLTRPIAEYIIHDMSILNIEGAGFHHRNILDCNSQSQISNQKLIKLKTLQPFMTCGHQQIQSYGTTTCHYITDNREMKPKKMDGHYSSENIS